MFRGCVTDTKFVGELADGIFRNIRGDSYRGDVSFLSTLRALVGPRVGEDSVRLRFKSTNFSASNIEEYGAKDVVEAMGAAPYEGDTGVITIHSLSGRKEDVDANFDIVKDFGSYYSGFEPLQKIEAFYRKSFKVACFIDSARKNVCLFVDNLNLAKLHFLQMSIIAFLPWYFSKEEGVTDLEMELVYSLAQNDKEKYIECLEKVADTFDFRSAKIRSLLSGFELQCEREEAQRVRIAISDLNSRIEDYNSRIADALREREDRNIRLLGLEAKISKGDEGSEIMDYFMANKNLSLVSVSGGQVEFYVRGFIEYFDPDMAESVINNRHGYVYEDHSNYDSEEGAAMRKLLTELFVSDSPRMRIRSVAGYMFDIRGNIRGLDNYSFGEDAKDYLPNPHINRYRCLGNYERVINTRLSDRDYVGAISQCAASCSSLNWGDSTVMRHFMRSMWDSMAGNLKFIELQDGSVVSVKDAVKWMESVENAEKEPDKEEA